MKFTITVETASSGDKMPSDTTEMESAIERATLDALEDQYDVEFDVSVEEAI